MEKMTIKQWRNVKGYSQKEFAQLCGIKFSSYHAKEAGKRPWKAFEIKNICNVLGISIETQLEY